MWYYEKCRDYLRYYELMFVFDENNTRKGRKHEGGRKIKMICCFFLIIVDLDPLLTLISMYLMILRISLVIYDNYNAIMCKLHDLRGFHTILFSNICLLILQGCWGFIRAVNNDRRILYNPYLMI